MTRATANFKINVVAPGAMPTWRAGQSVNEWREIAGSSLSLCAATVNYGSKPLSSRMDVWCGLALDTRNSTIWSCGNGGHDDWWGNDVYKIDMRSNAPAWVEVLAATSGWSVPNTAARYSDGSPASIHSYYSQQFIESRGKAIRFGLGAVATFGNARPVIDGFNPLTGVWEPDGTYPSWPAFTQDAPICKNTLTEDVYCFRDNYFVYKWTQSTNTVTTVNSGPPNTMYKAASCFDLVRGRIFLVNSVGAWTFDISTNTFTTRTLSGSGASIMRDAQCCIYEPTLDAYLSFIVESGAIKVYSTNPATFAVSLVSTSGTNPPIDIGPNGGGNPYGKWLYDPFLSGVVGFTNHSQNAFFLRTH